MTARIETTEVLSFRLKIPSAELQRLPEELRSHVRLSLEAEEGELLLGAEEADSYLRFKPIGTEAMLTEVFVSNDVRGNFFQRVLAPLMVRFGGDLHIRLTWNVPERNSQGDFAEVRIQRGASSDPSLMKLTSALAASAGAGQNALVPAQAQPDAGERLEQEQLTPLEREVLSALERARRHWEEYQRLKAKKGQSA